MPHSKHQQYCKWCRPRSKSVDSKGKEPVQTIEYTQTIVASSEYIHSMLPRSPYTLSSTGFYRRSASADSPRTPLMSSLVNYEGAINRASTETEEAEEDEEEEQEEEGPRSILCASLPITVPSVRLDSSLIISPVLDQKEEIQDKGRTVVAFPSKLALSKLRPLLESRESFSTITSITCSTHEPESTTYSDFDSSISPLESIKNPPLETSVEQIPSAYLLFDHSPELQHISSTMLGSPGSIIWKSSSTSHLHIAPFPPHPLHPFDSSLPLPIDSTPPAPERGRSLHRVKRRRSLPSNLRSVIHRNEVELAESDEILPVQIKVSSIDPVGSEHG